jgi:flagella basal body P-ring formation protein FlgA
VISVDGKKYRTIFPRVDIKVMQKVLVARGRIARGAPVGPDDVEVRRQALSASTLDTPLRSADELAGAEAVRELAPGTVLTSGMFRIPPIVKMGAVVSVTVVSGDITLIAEGEARSNGAMGQTIRVMNLESKKEFTARVVGPDRVEVKLED